MTTAEQIKECAEIVLEKFDGEVLFDTEVIIKSSPHIELFRCWGVAANIHHRLALKDSIGAWHEVLPDGPNVSMIVSSVLQRLKIIIHVGS